VYVRNFYFRIHGDRSFHCDVFGVCLDVQLRGNHRCRAGSAHDECCICLEVMYQFEVLIIRRSTSSYQGGKHVISIAVSEPLLIAVMYR
jgi:hypothetical protein